MTFAVAFYILLLIAFLVISALVFRHAFQFGNLAPSFKLLTIAFGILAAALIIFSLYFLLAADSGAPTNPATFSPPATSGSLNF